MDDPTAVVRAAQYGALGAVVVGVLTLVGVLAGIWAQRRQASSPPGDDGEELWKSTAFRLLEELQDALTAWRASSADGLPERFQRDPRRFLPKD